MKRVYLPAEAIPVGAFVQLGDGAVHVTGTRHDDDGLVILDGKGNGWLFDSAQRVEVLALPGRAFMGEVDQ